MPETVRFGNHSEDKITATILFEIIKFQILKPLNHVTGPAITSQKRV